MKILVFNFKSQTLERAQRVSLLLCFVFLFVCFRESPVLVFYLSVSQAWWSRADVFLWNGKRQDVTTGGFLPHGKRKPVLSAAVARNLGRRA